MNNHANSKLAVYSLSFISCFIVACFYVDVAVSASLINDGEPCETEVAAFDEDILTINNERYKALDGNVYKCQNELWVFEKTLKHARFKDIKVIKTADGCEAQNTITDATKQFVCSANFSSEFDAPSFLQLFGDNGWSMLTLLSPLADNVDAYMELNNQIMSGGEFLDNRVDLEQDIFHSGNQALRFFAVEPSNGMITSKSLIEKKGLYFANGDHLWFSGWYYFEKGMPLTIVDFENRYFKLGPGIRLFIRDGKYASLELKFATKPQYNQWEVKIPQQKWVHIKLHLVLSNLDDGVIELWQDDVQILSTTGKTLPTYDSIYNALQVGITATSMETQLLVDDVIVSDQPVN